MTANINDQSGTNLLLNNVVIEPSFRWVRVKLNDEFVADSKRVLLFRESSSRLCYWFPGDDVHEEFLRMGRLGSDGRQYYDVLVGDRAAESASWSYPDPSPDKLKLKAHYTFRWKLMDHWYEEEEEIFVHPRDPYHRIDTLPSGCVLGIELMGITDIDIDELLRVAKLVSFSEKAEAVLEDALAGDTE